MKSTETKQQLNYLVFRTNIDTDLAAARLIYVLEKTKEIESWNLDMNDCDRVLRIEFDELDHNLLIKNLSSFAIQIKEMPIW